jgi:integrase
MRTRLKGIHTAYGKGKAYYYAWKGGPRLRGAPGSAEFMASYNEAVAGKRPTKIGTVGDLVDLFESATEFTTGIKERTRQDYHKHMKVIRAEFGSMPIAALADPRVRGVFKGWRDRLAERSLRQADYAWTVLARIMSVAKGRGEITVNPCEKGGRVYTADRSESVWTDDHEAAFMTLAPPHLRLALQLALWTGQRQGDLLRLTWGNYDGKTIRLRQGKTSTRVVIPVGSPLKVLLDVEKAKKRGAMMLLTIEGTRWTADGFRSSWRKACAAAGIEGLSFHDLRGTAVTRLSLEGAPPQEVATITGLSLNDVNAILDAHYLHRDPALAEKAVKRLEARTVPSKPAAKPASGSGGAA